MARLVFPKRLRLLLFKAIQGLLIVLGGYVSVVLVGLIPVNWYFQAAQDDGVTIYVTSSSVHADLFLPIHFEDVLPSQSCMHIDFTSPEYYPTAKKIRISSDQYASLVAYIRGSIKREERGKPIQIKGYAYSQTDAFIKAHGSYHLLNTCNSWIGRALAKGGVKTPWLTPLPHTPTLYLD